MAFEGLSKAQQGRNKDTLGIGQQNPRGRSCSNGQTTFDSRRRNWVQFKLVTRGIANIRRGPKLTSFLAWVRHFGAWGHLLVSCLFFFLLPFSRAGPWVEWRQLATLNRLGNSKLKRILGLARQMLKLLWWNSMLIKLDLFWRDGLKKLTQEIINMLKFF